MRLCFLRSFGACSAAVCLFTLLTACSLLPGHRKAAKPALSDETATAGVGKRASARGLTIEVKESPDPVKLGENRTIECRVLVRNTTKKTVSLKFSTTQLIEILLREVDSGKVVSQWSTDQSFVAMTRYLIINPKERLEYVQPLTTRDLKPGKAYNLEAYLIGYDQDLRATRPLIPQP